MVCRKMIIGYFGDCDCEICLSINAKAKNNHCSKQKNSYKEITWVKNDVCMCKYCFEKLGKDNVTIAEGQENIEENIKHIKGSTDKDKKPNHPGKVSNDLLRLDDDNTLIDGSLVFSNILIDLDLCGSRDGERFIKRFFDGLEDVDHILAYKLAKAIEGTDVRFWMDLQEKYDEYMENH